MRRSSFWMEDHRRRGALVLRRASDSTINNGVSEGIKSASNREIDVIGVALSTGAFGNDNWRI